MSRGDPIEPPSDEEVAAIREAANEARLRVGTHAAHISDGWRKYGVSLDQQAVELWEDVHAAIKTTAVMSCGCGYWADERSGGACCAGAVYVGRSRK